MCSPHRFITSRRLCIWFRKLFTTTVLPMVTGVMMVTACKTLADMAMVMDTAPAPAMHRGITSVMAGKVVGMAIDAKLS